MSDIENELAEMMLELDKKNQEIMNDILNQQKEMIRFLEIERPKGKMVGTHGFSKEQVRLLWIDEHFKYRHMKKKIDSLAGVQHSIKLEFDNKKLPNPLFFNLDELIKNHTRIGELQARERERIMIRLGFWPANSPAASPHVSSAPTSSTIHPETGKKEIVPVHPKSTPTNFVPAGCKAGNITCSSLLKTNDLSHSDCDICCSEPLFCGDCCCILCCLSIDSATGNNKSFIRCEAKVKDGFICGHICHIECALRSYMAGTVGGKTGLDAEYYCRRCDARTDLIPHVENLLESCKSIDSGDKVQKILHICVLILQGSTKPRAKSLLHHAQSAVRKLMEGKSLEDIWKPEDTSGDTTGEQIKD